MQLGLGVLGWSPAQFWSSTVTELYAAYEGWQDSHGVERKQGLSEKDIAEIQKMMEKFSDHPASEPPKK